MNAIIRPRTLRVNVSLASGQPVTLSAVATGPRGLPGQNGVNGAQGPQGIQGDSGADGDLPYFASAHAAIAAADKLAGQKADGTKGHFTVQQLIEMALAYNAGIKTANAPILNLSETWNNGAVAFTGLKYDVTDTASDTNSLLAQWNVNGITMFSVRKGGKADFRSDVGIYSGSFSSSNGGRMKIGTRGGLGAKADGEFSLNVNSDSSTGLAQLRLGGLSFGATILNEGDGLLAQRDGVKAQTQRWYNTWTDASNFERGFLEWNTNAFRLGTGKAGTGVARELHFVVGDAACWKIDVSGHVRPITDGIFDIGSSGLRANHYYGAGNATIGASGAFIIQGRSKLKSSADGVFALYNNAETDFGRLQLGGTTASFPALKRASASLEVKLADDSAYANLSCAAINAINAISCTIATAIPAGGTAGAGFKFSSTTNFGVFFGSGAPSLSAAKGSLYLRSDGSGTSDRIYVNTNGTTGWAAVVTAS